MKQELLLGGATRIRVKALNIISGAQRCQTNGLSLAPLKEGRAMSAGQNPDLTVKRANLLITAAVQPLAVIQNQRPHGLFLNIILSIFDDEIGDLFGTEFFTQFGAHFGKKHIAGAFAGELAGS